MMTFNTGNAIGSTDARDLYDNAQNLDHMANSQAATYADRFGVQRRTLAGLEAEFPNAAANAAAAQAAAAQAANEADSAATAVGLAFNEATNAQAARTGAEAARDAAQLSAGVYATTAAGLAATTTGRYFSVPSASNEEYLILYLNSGGSAAEVDRYASAAAVQYALNPFQNKEKNIPFYGVTSYVSNTVLNDDWTFTQTATADCWFNLGKTWYQSGANTVDVLIDVISGVFAATSTIDQRTSSDAVIAGTTVTPAMLASGLFGYRGIVLDPNCAYLRVRLKTTSGTTVFNAPVIQPSGVRLQEFASSANVSASLLLPSNDANNVRNYFNVRALDNITVGSGGAATIAGRTLTIPYGTLVELSINNTDGLVASDAYVVLFKLNKPFRGTIGNTLKNSTGVAGGTADAPNQEHRYLGSGWYMMKCGAAATGGANPAYHILRLDNRAATSGSVVMSSIWIGKNPPALPSFVNAPRAIMDALTDAGVSIAYVDPAGNDVNSGSRSSPFATIGKAVSSGASRIYLRRSSTPYRHGGFALTSNTSLLSYAESGDTAEYAQVFCSTGVNIAATPKTVADANVYYYATATAPGALWESVAGVATRIGVVQPGGVLAAYPQASASEAAVRSSDAANGAWWFGAGSEGQGIYFRPRGDVATNKLLEVSNADIGVSITGADLTQRGVQLSFGRVHALSAQRANVRSTDCLFKHSGTSDGVAVNDRVNWIDERCIFEDAGDDGLNTNGNGAKTLSIGSEFKRNIGDGFAPHGIGNDCEWIACKFNNNGKQGMVTIGQGKYAMWVCEARGNADKDIYFLIEYAIASTITMHDNHADSCRISTSSQAASWLTGTVTDHRGPLDIKANVEVKGHRGKGLYVIDGAVSVEDFHYSGATAGIRIDAGTLTPKQGHVLRCTTGVDQRGGTLVLDSASPVNVYGNVTQFSGVSSADQEKTVSIAAV